MKRSDRLSHRAFLVGIFLKGLDGCFELIGAAALFLTTQPAIRHAVDLLTREELAEDPSDFLANHAVHMAQQLSVSSQHFAALYLLGHGAIKVALVAGLFRGLRWSYPAALAFLAAFVIYQMYRLSQRPSLLLAALTLIDLIVLLLIWHEWRRACARPRS